MWIPGRWLVKIDLEWNILRIEEEETSLEKKVLRQTMHAQAEILRRTMNIQSEAMRRTIAKQAGMLFYLTPCSSVQVFMQ